MHQLPAASERDKSFRRARFYTEDKLACTSRAAYMYDNNSNNAKKSRVGPYIL